MGTFLNQNLISNLYKNDTIRKNSNYLQRFQKKSSFAYSLPLQPTSLILKSKIKLSLNSLKSRSLKNMYRKRLIIRAARKKLKRVKIGSRIKFKIIRRYRRFKKVVLAKKNDLRLKRIKEANEKRVKSQAKFKFNNQIIKL